MAGNDPSAIDRGHDTAEKDVAVGIVATETNSEGVARTILRAQERGYRVLVTHAGTPNIEGVRFANRLGATVVPCRDPDPDIDTLRENVVRYARANDASGVLFQNEYCDPIDYERSERALQGDQFVTNAVPQSATDEDADTVLVGIPAYNEADAIGDVIKRALPHADSVVVVDDGSDDETARIAERAGATVIEHETNRGYGVALKTLFREAARRRVGHLVVLDADGQHEPADIPRVVEHQRETGCEIVIGSRFVDGARTDIPLHRRLGLSIINVATNLSMGIIRSKSWIRDTQSGFRAYDSRAIMSLARSGEVGDSMTASIDILYHAHANDYDVREISTSVYYDVENASTHHPVSHGLRLVRNLLRTIETRRPISVLGVPGLVSTLVGFGFAYWTLLNYVNTGGFPYGLAITATFFALLGIFLTFTAIILHALNRHLDS